MPTRLAAIEALGKLEAAVAVPIIVEALTDEEYDVRKAAIQALFKIGAPEALKGIKNYEKSNRYR